MEHSDKVRHLEELRQRRRLGGMVIYPVANQEPFAFAQAAEPVALQRPGALSPVLLAAAAFDLDQPAVT